MVGSKLLFPKFAVLLVVCFVVFTSSVQAINSKENHQNCSKGHLVKEEMGLFGPVRMVKVFLPNSNTDYVTFVFREDGSLTSIENTPYSSRTFDSKERPLKEQIIDPNGMKLDAYSNYDEDEQIFTTKTTAGVVLRVGKMDSTGHIVEVNNYDINGHYVGKTTYEYDKVGLIIRTSRYTFTNILMSKSEFSYDSNGYNIERTFYKATTMPPTELQLDTKEIKRYDSQGRLIEIEVYLERTNTINKRFYTFQEFDSYGNWTKSLEKVPLLSGEDRLNILTRQIEYYE